MKKKSIDKLRATEDECKELYETYNHHWNSAIKTLMEYHPVIHLVNSLSLDMTNKPVIRSKRAWLFYLDALQSVIVIGRRNDWLHFHINRAGHAVHWVLKPKGAETNV